MSGRPGGVGGNTAEAELRGLDGQRLVDAAEVHVRGMPVQHGVDVVEETRAHHVDLARSAFFRRRAVDADGSRRAAALQPVRDRDAGRDRGGAEQVMAAGVTGVLARDRRTVCHGVLVDAWQRVELGEQADHRLAAAGGRDEGRRDPGDAGLDLEPGLLQLLLQERGALRLLVADFRPVPDRFRDLGVARGTAGEELAHPVARVRRVDRRRKQGKTKAEGDSVHLGFRGRCRGTGA